MTISAHFEFDKQLTRAEFAEFVRDVARFAGTWKAQVGVEEVSEKEIDTELAALEKQAEEADV